MRWIDEKDINAVQIAINEGKYFNETELNESVFSSVDTYFDDITDREYDLTEISYSNIPELVFALGEVRKTSIKRDMLTKHLAILAFKYRKFVNQDNDYIEKNPNVEIPKFIYTF